MKLRVLVRLLEIQRVLLRHGLDDYVRATHLYRPLRFLFFLSPAVWFERRRAAARGVRLRLALEELGPIFVKFGQAVSTRRDLLPADIADELAKLQDRVPPFPGTIARALLERAYGGPLAQVFAEFDETPLAAASIAQVHAARLPDGAGSGGQGAAAGHARGDRARPGGAARARRAGAALLRARRGACGRARSSTNTRRPSSTSSI